MPCTEELYRLCSVLGQLWPVPTETPTPSPILNHNLNHALNTQHTLLEALVKMGAVLFSFESLPRSTALLPEWKCP